MQQNEEMHSNRMNAMDGGYTSDEMMKLLWVTAQ